MVLPYEGKDPPENWSGWNRLRSFLDRSDNFSRDDLSPQEQEEFDELFKYVRNFQETSIPNAVVNQACSSPDFVAVCVIISGAWDFEWQTELTQLQDGNFLLREWGSGDNQTYEIHSFIQGLDLKRELENIRKEGFNLRGSDNKNPNLDTGEETRVCEIYLAVGTDIEWLECPRFMGKGRYKNNAVNRILLVELAWNDFVSNYREELQLNKPEIRETLGERLKETLARRNEDSDIKLV